MNIRKSLVATLALAAMVAPTMLLAGARDGTGASIGPRAAYFIPEGSSGDEVWFGGAQVRVYFNDAFALEGSIDYRETDFGQTTLQTYPVQATLLLNLVRSDNFKMFLLGGGGWYYTRVDVPVGSDDTDNRFGPHAGAGILVPFSDNVSLDITGRYIWLEEAHADDQNVLERDYDDSGVMLTAGLNFHF